MKVVISTATFEGYDKPSGNRARISSACELIEKAAGDGALLVVLPGGFLFGDEHRVGDEIVAVARRQRLAVAFGVSSCARSKARRGKGHPAAKGTRRSADGLPYFVVGIGTEGTEQTWQQRSTSRADGWDLGPAEPEHRFLEVDGRQVDVLACGEVFSRTLREACLTWGIRVIVSPFHTAARSRYHHAVEWARNHRISCLRAVHTASSARLGGTGAVKLASAPGLTGWLAQV